MNYIVYSARVNHAKFNPKINSEVKRLKESGTKRTRASGMLKKSLGEEMTVA